MKKTFAKKQLFIIKDLTNYPKEFVEPYLKCGRFQRCPVYLNAFLPSRAPLLWDELFQSSELTDEENEQLVWSQQFDIYSGLLTTQHFPDSTATFLHFAGNEKNINYELRRKTKLMVLSLIQIIDYKVSLLLKDTLKPTSPRLSSREQEVLIWAARGKTIWETAKILGLSQSTVREHLVHCQEKFQTYNKVELVAKAMCIGSIQYNDLI